MQLISNHNLARHHRHETLCLLGLFLECKNVFLIKSKGSEGAAQAQANFLLYPAPRRD